MLSYRHAFHAGNHADILKHSVLTLLIDYLKQKQKPLWYFDTHAGAGLYALDSIEAKKNAEFAGGIARLLEHRADMPEFMHTYFSAMDALNPVELQKYPGSPYLAAQLLREQDRLRLFEMHPQDAAALNDHFLHDRRVQSADSDGFVGLKALLPPPSRRGLVLIDPSYELKEDYARVVVSIQDALRRFATGTYAIWYPLLPRAESARLPQQLMALPTPWLRIELRVAEPRGEFGMYGSGMFVVNPPWLLHDQMKILLPILQEVLGEPDHCGFLLESAHD